MKTLIATIFALAILGIPAFADGHATGDASVGEDLFKKCKACHSIVGPEAEIIRKGGKVGPNLYGIFGRIAGRGMGFSGKYGDSISKAGEKGLTWDEVEFISYVADPKKFLAAYLEDKNAKSKMGYKLKKEEDAKNIWAYLVSVGTGAVN